MVNLEFCADWDAAAEAIAQLTRHARGRMGALVDARTDLLQPVLDAGLDVIALSHGAGERLQAHVAAIHARGQRVFVVATDVDGARAGQAAGADAVVAKGSEAGGWIGEEGAFVLLQRCVAELTGPVWAHGGAALRTAAACLAAEAVGVVLDSQLLLARESPLPAGVRSRIRAMDGAETVVIGADTGAPLRIYDRGGLAPVARLRELEGGDPERWLPEARRQVDWHDPALAALAVGQDAASASELADRFVTVGGIVSGLAAAATDQLRVVGAANPLAEGTALAESHGTRYPIVQGPMTRVSDRPEFAAAVAEGGALPFLALALMRGPEVAA